MASKTLRKSSQESCSMYSRLPVVPSSRRMISQARQMSLARLVRFMSVVSSFAAPAGRQLSTPTRLRLVQALRESRDGRAEALGVAEALHHARRIAHTVERRRAQHLRLFQFSNAAQPVLVEQRQQDFACGGREAVDEVGVARGESGDALLPRRRLAPE